MGMLDLSQSGNPLGNPNGNSQHDGQATMPYHQDHCCGFGIRYDHILIQLIMTFTYVYILYSILFGFYVGVDIIIKQWQRGKFLNFKQQIDTTNTTNDRSDNQINLLYY